MFDGSSTNKQWIGIYPKSFPALMELYEDNYIYLRRLCPYLKHLRGRHVSRLSGKGHDLHLHCLDSTPHTTTLRLTYQMLDGSFRPDLKIRMYHDARQVEVLSRQCRITGVELKTQRSVDESALLCRWRLNRFLNKWLSYSLRQGHSFIPRVVETTQKAEILD